MQGIMSYFSKVKNDFSDNEAIPQQLLKKIPQFHKQQLLPLISIGRKFYERTQQSHTSRSVVVEKLSHETTTSKDPIINLLKPD